METVLASAHAEFDSEVVYLNTASLGLSPRRSMDALQNTIQQWRVGRASPPDYDAPLSAARASYAAIVGVESARVAVGSQASVFVGLVAASLPDGAEVLTAAGEFTSVLFPFLAQSRRSITVREVALEHLADEVRPTTTLVAVSAVQSADGRLADLDAITRACADNGTRVLVDVTQAVGWLPVDASRFAYTVCSGWKWLLAPKGTCFFTVDPQLADGLIPHYANWYAGTEPWSSIYGAPLRLANDARRFDMSPVWHSWVAQAPALDLLIEVGPEALYTHAVGLASSFRTGVGLAPGDSAIVSIVTTAETMKRVERAGVIGSVRAGRLRLAFHVNNCLDDVDRAVEVLNGFVVH